MDLVVREKISQEGLVFPEIPLQMSRQYAAGLLFCASEHGRTQTDQNTLTLDLPLTREEGKHFKKYFAKDAITIRGNNLADLERAGLITTVLGRSIGLEGMTFSDLMLNGLFAGLGLKTNPRIEVLPFTVSKTPLESSHISLRYVFQRSLIEELAGTPLDEAGKFRIKNNQDVAIKLLQLGDRSVSSFRIPPKISLLIVHSFNRPFAYNNQDLFYSWLVDATGSCNRMVFWDPTIECQQDSSGNNERTSAHFSFKFKAVEKAAGMSWQEAKQLRT